MACGGHCNQCTTHPGYIGPVTPTAWSNDPVVTSTPVYDDHYNEIRASIKAELTRRSLTEELTYPDPGDQATDDVVYSNDYRYLRNQIRKAGSDTWLPNTVIDSALSASEVISAATTNAMRIETNSLESECICNCNYSCTCNCNYCTCNCNHICQCNCNYSDERLKKEIIYL